MKWVHNMYNQEEEWWFYTTTPHSSWYWRKIVEVKNQIRNTRSIQSVMIATYSIKENYMFIKGTHEKQFWASMVWARFSIPKHKFILWHAVQDRLKTKKRLQKMKIVIDSYCLICGKVNETSDHLFFNCEFNMNVWRNIKM